MEEVLDNYSDDYSSKHALIREPISESSDYSTNSSFAKSLASNKLISFFIILSLLIFFGVIVGEKSKIFSKIIPRLRGEIVLPNNYVITSINQTFPILIRKDCPRLAQHLRFRGNVESIFDDAALNLCSRQEKVVDIGAHFGYNAIVLGQLLRVSGKYIAIEGNPPVSRCLYKNIILNDLSDTVKTILIAVSDHKGTCDITEDSLLHPDEEDDRTVLHRRLIVECDTLDNILKDEEVSLILVSVPAAAFDVIRGAKNIIDRTDNLKILVRMNTNTIDKSIDIRGDLTSLNRRGFRFYEVVSANEIKEIFIDEIIDKKRLILLMKKEK
jgi:FkbM family methyltransferase